MECTLSEMSSNKWTAFHDLPDRKFFSCMIKLPMLQTKKPERWCPRVWRHRQMPHQHSFCKGEQAMSESFNTIPSLRMQPTSMLFSMNGDPLSRRELFGYGFIMLCCEDWDIDYRQCSVYTTETLEKHLERVSPSITSLVLSSHMPC